MIALYAIGGKDAAPDLPLRAVRSGGLTAVCGPAAPAHRVTEADLWRHEEIVERLMEGADVLPVRFGTLLADEEAVARALDERQPQLVACLARVRGAVELALRVDAAGPQGGAHDAAAGPPPAVGAGATAGRAYLRAKRRRRDAARVFHAPLDRRARDSVVRATPELLRAAYLVDRDGVPAFVAEVRGLQAAHPELVAVCTGPWPPYSFAEAGAA